MILVPGGEPRPEPLSSPAMLTLRFRRRAPVLMVLLAFALVACTQGGGQGPARSPSGSAGASPSGSAVATAATYPGWPGDGSVVATDIVPIIVSTELAVGPNRFLVSLVDRENQLLASPDLPVRLRFFDLAADPNEPVTETPARFQWMVENELGLYVAPAEFDRAGDWGVELIAGGGGRAPERSTRVLFQVREESSTPSIGEKVPASDTPTAADAKAIRSISTDSAPDPDFYRLSIADAVKAGKPFLVVFSTPAFCQTRACGPALEIAKEAATPYKERVNFVHVEPYRLAMQDGQLQPELDARGQFQAVPAVEEWGLPTEPYLFVVNADGTLAAKFQGVASKEELTEALDQVAG